MQDMDYYEYEESQKRFTPAKVIGFIFKVLAYAIIIAVFAVIFIRIQGMKIPKKFSEYTWTPAAVAAAADGELSVDFQEPYESYDDNGYYHISNVALTKETGEVQFTVRYNSRSTINKLMQTYGLTERPVGETFVYILADQDGKTYTHYTFAAGQKPMYELRRVIFDGVDLSAVETLYLDVYYGDDVSKDGRMNASFVIYDKSLGVLSGEDMKIADFQLEFREAPAYVNRLEG